MREDVLLTKTAGQVHAELVTYIANAPYDIERAIDYSVIDEISTEAAEAIRDDIADQRIEEKRERDLDEQ